MQDRAAAIDNGGFARILHRVPVPILKVIVPFDGFVENQLNGRVTRRSWCVRLVLRGSDAIPESIGGIEDISATLHHGFLRTIRPRHGDNVIGAIVGTGVTNLSCVFCCIEAIIISDGSGNSVSS